MSTQRPSHSSHSTAEAPLISGTTIVILSAFLIGMFASRLVRPGMEPLVLLAGVVGLISYLALEHTARQRQAQRSKARSRRVARRLEKKCDEHLAHEIVVRSRPRAEKFNPEDSQYLTVVTRSSGTTHQRGLK